MPKRYRTVLLSLFALPALLTSLPADTFARSLPVGCVVIVPQRQVSVAPVMGQGKKLTPRIGTFRERLHALRNLRGMLRTAVEDGKADRLAKRSLTFGIIAMSALALAWIPVVGAILVLGSVPMGVLAIVDGLKARKMGSEKYAGLVLGIVSVALFLLVMVIALVLLVSLFALWG